MQKIVDHAQRDGSLQTYYIILCRYLKQYFDIKAYNVKHEGHDCLWYHIYVHDN
jgi:hypothetical protein